MREKEKDFEPKGDMDKGDGGGRGFYRRRGCRFCADPAILIDFKDKYLLKPFLTERFKIVPRRISGNCAKHQRQVTVAVKRARHLAVVPYTSAQIWSKNV